YPKSWLVLQSLLSETLISTWAGKNVDFDLAVNMMPFPPMWHDSRLVQHGRKLPWYLVFSFMPSVFHTTKEIVEEKEKKIKESLKLMGMLPSVYWASWFIIYFAYVAAMMLVYVLYACTTSAQMLPLLYKSDTSLFCAFLMCYAAAIVSFSLMVSVFFARGFPGISWSNYHEPVYPNNLPLSHVMLMLLFDTAIHLTITWYLDTVLPGEFGVPQPYNFFLTVSLVFSSGSTSSSRLAYNNQSTSSSRVWRIVTIPGRALVIRLLPRGKFDVPQSFYDFLTRSYWCPSQRIISSSPLTSDQHQEHAVQDEPRGLEAGIQIRNLRKVFPGGRVAVDNLTLNMYEGHITALLGHNGAGKTTTMFMLSGFYPPTSGTAVVNGYDITSELGGVWESLGVCPQHDVLFDTLTVKEHLVLFAKLKGCPPYELYHEVNNMLKDTGLEAKQDSLVRTLSGGQRRRLSVGIALIYYSKVVILDEPTTGVDPSARRQLWDLLDRHREGRTIMLSTHFMDEADALGDRIAIMADGKLMCCGTPMFLKKRYGIGYHLVIVKATDCKVSKVTRVIRKAVPGATFQKEIQTELFYLMPDKQVSRFVALFKDLEARKEELGILSFGASGTTMEDVFLRFV
ncbi:hypothetical protein BaRGS_00029318, partial [Batillaria attramentaria]